MVYKKWRELSVDPYQIKYEKVKLKEIVSYLPAGNDVLECICEYHNKDTNLIIKFERSKMADFESELKTLAYLQKTNYCNVVPKVIESGEFGSKKYVVLEKKEGKRLSELFANKKANRPKYLYKYGQSLGEFHLLKPTKFHLAKQRLINDIPNKNHYKSFDKKIEPFIKFLKENKPRINYDTFIHGDYHYANILWKYGKISAVLDFEYSGLGFKEQDIAWAITLRPLQKFMDNIEDIKEFLKGYSSVNKYDSKLLKWCLINACCHFYLMNRTSEEYQRKLLRIISNLDKIML